MLLRSLLVFALCGLHAWAAPVLQISPSLGVTVAGGTSDPSCNNGSLLCIIFQGTITPDGTDDYYLNDLQITFTPANPDLVNIPTFFTLTVPGFLAASDPIYTGPIFALEVSPNIAPGVYNGTAFLLGGINGPGDASQLSFFDFQVQVNVPEPATLPLVAAAIGALLLRRRRS